MRTIMHTAKYLVVVVWIGWLMATAVNSTAADESARLPVIDVTDLYHPHQDVGDNFDVLAAYGLPELDLKAVILDVTQALRTDKRGLTEAFQREGRGRDAGFVSVLQLNAIFDRDVPCATTPYLAMKSAGDKMLAAPRFQQSGIDLILGSSAESVGRNPVAMVGSVATEAWVF
jgi:hypothetical protein